MKSYELPETKRRAARRFRSFFYSVAAFLSLLSLLCGIESANAAPAFQIEDRVQVTATLSVFSSASLSGTNLGTQAVGARGTVVAGPVSADGISWWRVNFDTGANGYGREDSLQLFSPSLPACVGTVRLVGPTRTFTKISQAAAVVQTNDCVHIDAGTYENDFALARWPASASNVTIRGVGGRAKLIITSGDLSAGMSSDAWKGIWVLNGTNTTVENVEFACATSRTNNPFCSGMHATEGNDAGIRLQAPGLTVRNCVFRDNDNGILGGPTTTVPASEILIEHSEFFRNGWGDGQSHNLYLNEKNTVLTFRYNHSHGAIVGHNLKSRAAKNYVLYNRIMDETNGVTTDCTDPGTCAASAEIEFPCGGLGYVIGNVVEKASNADARDVIKYAAEYTNTKCPTSSAYELYVINNTVVSNYGPNTFYIRGYNPTALLWTKNNIFWGGGTLITWPTGGTQVTANNVTADPKLLSQSAFDFHLTANSTAVINQGVNPGTDAHGFNLTPTQHYVYDKQTVSRPNDGQLDVGAYEYTPGATPFAPLPLPTPPAPVKAPVAPLPAACSGGQQEAVYSIATSGDDGMVKRSGADYSNLGQPTAATGGYGNYINYAVRKNQGSSPYVTQLALWRWNTATRPDGSAWPANARVVNAFARPYWVGTGLGTRVPVFEWHNWSAPLSNAAWTNSSVVAADPTFAATISLPAANGRQTVELSNSAANVNLAGYTGLRLTLSDGTAPAAGEEHMVSAVPVDLQTTAGDRSTQLVVCYTLSGGSDATLPTIAITQPASSVSSSTLTLSGTAADNTGGSGLLKVEVRLNGGAWELANGTSTWSKLVTLAPGANALQARAVDNAQNISSIGTVSVTYNAPSGGGGTNSWSLLSPVPQMRWVPTGYTNCTTKQLTANAIGRTYSGTAIGNGKIIYWGGGHASYPANDVDLYDIASNTWIPDPRQPDCLAPCTDIGPNTCDNYPYDCSTGSGGSYNLNCLWGSGIIRGGVGCSKNVFVCAGGSRDKLTCSKDVDCPGGTCPVNLPVAGTTCTTCRPYTEHTYQRQAWNPVREKFLVYSVSGTYELDPTTRAWSRLGNPPNVGSGDQATRVMVWHPVRQQMFWFQTSGSNRGTSRYDYSTSSWVTHSTTFPPPITGSSEVFASYDGAANRFFLYAPAGGGHYWIYNPDADTFVDVYGTAPADVRAICAGGASRPCATSGMVYDETNQRTMVLVQDAPGVFGLWAYNMLEDSWTKVPTSGATTVNSVAGYPNTLSYDPTTRALFVIDRDVYWPNGNPSGTGQVRTWKITVNLGSLPPAPANPRAPANIRLGS